MVTADDIKVIDISIGATAADTLIEDLVLDKFMVQDHYSIGVTAADTLTVDDDDVVIVDDVNDMAIAWVMHDAV